MKTLVVGGTKDFGAEVTKYLGPNSMGIGRTNGFDVSVRETRNRIVEMSLEYERVVVVVSKYQSELVEAISFKWLEKNHDGYLICFGTTAIYHDQYKRPLKELSYLRGKAGLQLLSRYIGEKVAVENVRMRFTNIQLGKLDNAKARAKEGFKIGVKSKEVCDLIQYLSGMPSHLCCHELFLDPKY